jgi:hypothetical protein
MLFERNDLQRLYLFSEREANLHELKNLVTNNKDLSPYREKIIELLKKSRRVSSIPVDSSCNIKQLFCEVRRERIRIYKKTQKKPVEHKISGAKYLNEHLPITIETTKYAPLKINMQTGQKLREIYKNLLINFLTHGNKEKDKLEVKYFKKNDTLHMSQTFNKLPYSPHGKIWFISPHEFGGEVHSGLFIVGTLTRQLGGYVFTHYDNYDKYNKLKRFDIYINLKNLKSG